jgi:hypothetical protein
MNKRNGIGVLWRILGENSGKCEMAGNGDYTQKFVEPVVYCGTCRKK